MIRISQLKIRTGHTEEALVKKLLQLLRIKKEELLSYEYADSLWTRGRNRIFFMYIPLMSV